MLHPFYDEDGHLTAPYEAVEIMSRTGTRMDLPALREPVTPLPDLDDPDFGRLTDSMLAMADVAADPSRPELGMLLGSPRHVLQLCGTLLDLRDSFQRSERARRALQLHIADVAAELAARDRLDAMFGRAALAITGRTVAELAADLAVPPADDVAFEDRRPVEVVKITTALYAALRLASRIGRRLSIVDAACTDAACTEVKS